MPEEDILLFDLFMNMHAWKQNSSVSYFFKLFVFLVSTEVDNSHRSDEVTSINGYILTCFSLENTVIIVPKLKYWI